MSAVAVDRWVLDNDVDARTTMQRMARFCRQAMLDAAIVRAANEVIATVNARQYPEQIAAIRTFLDEYFRFVNNPAGVQLIRDPASMLADIEDRGFTQGACDDAAVLIATFGMANGIPARFRALAFCYHLGGAQDCSATFSHVIADLYDGREWRPLDVTRPFDADRPAIVARELTVLV